MSAIFHKLFYTIKGAFVCIYCAVWAASEHIHEIINETPTLSFFEGFLAEINAAVHVKRFLDLLVVVIPRLR